MRALEKALTELQGAYTIVTQEQKLKRVGGRKHNVLEALRLQIEAAAVHVRAAAVYVREHMDQETLCAFCGVPIPDEPHETCPACHKLTNLGEDREAERQGRQTQRYMTEGEMGCYP